MLYETIGDNDSYRNTALQHCSDIVLNRYNIFPTLQRCVALKIVVANRAVQHHLREWGFQSPGNFCLWNPGFWSLESRIQLNPAQSRKFHSRLEYSTWNPESRAWNPGSKTVSDCLTWLKFDHCIVSHGFRASLSISPLGRSGLRTVPLQLS